MMDDLLRAFALYMILEGLLPAIMPEAWKETISKMTEMSSSQLRIFGVVSIAIGALLFQLAA